MSTAWHLALRAGAAPRVDRPASISLTDGLTIGRGQAAILLDSEKFPALISRIHATIFLDEALGPVIENHSVNRVKLVGRTGGQYKASKVIKLHKRGVMTEGCEVIFGPMGSLDEFPYVLRRGEPDAWDETHTIAEREAAEDAAAAKASMVYDMVDVSMCFWHLIQVLWL